VKALIRSVVLAITLLATSLTVTAKPAPAFSDTLSKATLAVYAGKQVCGYKPVDTFFGLIDVWSCEFKTHFTCTATVVDKDGQGGYVGLTAGHCFNYELMDSGVKYYVSEALSEKPVLNEITLRKFDFSSRYDYAVFTFQSMRDYPAIETLKDGESVPAIGTAVLNANYSLGIVKQVLEGKVVSKQVTLDEGGPNCDGYCSGRYFVSIGLGRGASGSAVVDAKTHKIIGLVEIVFPGTQMATGVMPMGKQFIDFVNDASAGIKPQKPKGPEIRIHPVASAPARVPTLKELVLELISRFIHKIKFWS
jgi:hypothetical protein